MPAVETTNIYFVNAVEIAYGKHRDELMTFAGAGTVLKGTLLARRSDTGKIVPFAVGGATGTGTIIGVLTYDVAASGAGDVAFRMLVGGDVNRNRLIIHADGHGNNINSAQMDAMRNVGITPVDVQALPTHTV